MKYNVGDKIAYSVKFLRSIGEGPTSFMCHARGTITKLDKYSESFVIAKITWDSNPDGMLPDGVNTFNLAKVPGSKTVQEDGIVGTVQPNAAFCAC